MREIESFPLGLDQMSQDTKLRLGELTDRLMESFKHHKQRKETRYQTTGKVVYDEFNQKPSKPIIDEIDRVLAKHYGLTDEDLDFIINYDIKYRMGLEASFETNTNTNNLLELAAKVYEGLSDADLDDMEEIIHDRRNFFGERT